MWKKEKNNDNRKDIPDYMQDMIDKLIKQGAEVDVIKINRKKDKDADKAIKKLEEIRKELLDMDDASVKEAVAKDMREFHKKPGLSTTEIYNNMCNSFMHLIKVGGIAPRVACSFIISKEGNMSISTLNINNKQELADLFKALARAIENDNDITIENRED